MFMYENATVCGETLISTLSAFAWLERVNNTFAVLLSQFSYTAICFIRLGCWDVIIIEKLAQRETGRF